MWSWVSRYQNIYTLDFIGAKGDGGGGDNQSYKVCKTPVKSTPPTNQHPMLYRPDVLPVAKSTVKALKGKFSCTQGTQMKDVHHVSKKPLPTGGFDCVDSAMFSELSRLFLWPAA